MISATAIVVVEMAQRGISILPRKFYLQSLSVLTCFEFIFGSKNLLRMVCLTFFGNCYKSEKTSCWFFQEKQCSSRNDKKKIKAVFKLQFQATHVLICLLNLDLSLLILFEWELKNVSFIQGTKAAESCSDDLIAHWFPMMLGSRHLSWVKLRSKKGSVHGRIQSTCQ